MAEEKILKDEILSDEELENVAGGTAAELAKDIKFLNALGIKTKNYSMDEIKSNAFGIGIEITNLIGGDLTIYADIEYENDYRIVSCFMGEDDTYLTRAEFYKKVCEQVGKPDFDYKKYL